MEKIDIQERLNTLLKYLKINQKEFSLRTGIPQNTLSHAKKGKHLPGLSFFNSIYKSLPDLNAKWLYMGMGDMISETCGHIVQLGKNFNEKISNRRWLQEDDCNRELESAEMEIEYLKTEVEDKKEIIELLKRTG